jgi:23S rRNA (pseudouridine1915-N3)-methyltransferase
VKATLYYIGKPARGEVAALQRHYAKQIGGFGQIEVVALMPKAVQAAQKQGAQAARRSYSEVFEPYLNEGVSVALDERGRSMDSHRFSALLLDEPVRFFVGGAYGLEPAFVARCRFSLSLSSLTLSHDLARLVLLEQIYRGLSIIHNHPYHK